MVHGNMDLEGDRLAYFGWGLLVALAGAAWFITEFYDRQPAEGFAFWLLFSGIGGFFLGAALGQKDRIIIRAVLIWVGSLSAFVSVAILLSLWEIIEPAEGGALAVLIFGFMILLWAYVQPPASKTELFAGADGPPEGP